MCIPSFAQTRGAVFSQPRLFRRLLIKLILGLLVSAKWSCLVSSPAGEDRTSVSMYSRHVDCARVDLYFPIHFLPGPLYGTCGPPANWIGPVSLLLSLDSLSLSCFTQTLPQRMSLVNVGVNTTTLTWRPFLSFLCQTSLSSRKACLPFNTWLRTIIGTQLLQQTPPPL